MLLFKPQKVSSLGSDLLTPSILERNNLVTSKKITNVYTGLHIPNGSIFIMSGLTLDKNVVEMLTTKRQADS